MQKTKFILLGCMLAIVIGTVGFSLYPHKNIPASGPVVPTTQNEPLVYTNSEYGFTFDLPTSWKGYTIVEETWTGNTLPKNTKDQSGPKLILRHPLWTQAHPYEDIPVLVFTLSQWDSYIKEEFAVSAAPVPAQEIGRNTKYVFALPPRWDFDYSEGYKEAEDIVNSKPLKGFDK